jgi:hypothetical protein
LDLPFFFSVRALLAGDLREKNQNQMSFSREEEKVFRPFYFSGFSEAKD